MGALAPKIQNQLNRPTCSAFTGIRAIEILLAQKNKYIDLSEQYFYWSSKPKCRNKKYSNKGSWVGYGFEFSKQSSSPDIPTEKNCKYISNPTQGNETQIPLKRQCKSPYGHVKVSSFKYLKTLDQVAVSIGHACISEKWLIQNRNSNPFVVLNSIKL